MHDDTNVSMLKTSDPALQRNTWSSYYSGNEAKGGVLLMLCGWINTSELWAGAVSGTKYATDEILPQQEEFAKTDPTSSVPFTNMLNKGY
jgi:hypothetical protein